MAEKNRDALHQGMMQRNAKLYKKSQDGCKFVNLYDRVIHPDNVMTAYQSLMNNNGSFVPSVDGLSISDLKKMPFTDILQEIKNRLDRYTSDIVKYSCVSKCDGGRRPFGVPSIWDRLIQRCILQVLEPIFEAKFHSRSYGFRPKRNAENAIADMAFKLNRQHLRWTVNIDIYRFFENVNHNILIKVLRRQGITDVKLLMIIKQMLKSKVIYPDGHMLVCDTGIFQCGILSTFFANVYLNELDWWISNQWETFDTEKDYLHSRSDGTVDRSGLYRALRTTNLKEMYIIRYADNFKIVTDTKAHADAIMCAVKLWLWENLRLTVSDSYVCDMRHDSCDFLGFTLKLVKKGRGKDGMQRYVLGSHVSKGSVDKIHEVLSDQIKKIQHAGNSRRAINELMKYNSIVIRVHNYYSIATDCNNDFNVLGASIQKKLYNHLVRNNDVKRGRTKDFRRYSEYNGDDERYKKYMKSKTVRWYKNYPILPIGYIQHRNPMMKKKEPLYLFLD